jgi:radical SAM superfamily enzyme YgiQ (UPF0313 family)/GT2 family glycosyltransferase
MAEDKKKSPSLPVSVVIPNYNGRKLLGKYLPGILRAAGQYPAEVEIIVADDCSTDDSVEFIQENSAGIRVETSARNRGFLKNAMKGITAANNRIIILLNSDVDVSPDFINHMIPHFDDPLVFAVVAKSLVPRIEDFNESLTYAVFEDGLLGRRQAGLYPQFEKTIVDPQPCFYPAGGFSAYDKDKLLLMGGFDPLFSPGYWEDADIGFRAWQSGWKIIYEPRSVVHHESHASMGQDNIRELRNQILFTWKNLVGAKRWLAHGAHFFRSLIHAMDKNNPEARFRAWAFLVALKRLPQALFRRWTIPNEKRRRCEEILDMLAPPSEADMRLQQAASQLCEFRRKAGFKCLLIDPPGHQKGVNVGLAYLASSLAEAGIHVKVLDLNNVFCGASLESVCQYIRQGDFSLIGFSVKTSTYKNAVELADSTKQRFPELIHVAGGPHVTLCTEEFLRENSWCDYAFAGEGEETLVELCKRIDEGALKELEASAGVAYLQNGKLMEGGKRHVKDLDSLPLPLYEAFECMEFKDSEYPLITSRGCPYSCIYCSVGKISGRVWRSRSLDEITAELRLAQQRYGVTRFNILDDTFSQNINRAKEFCRTLIDSELDLPWACGNGIRADRVDEEFAALMKESGCEIVMLGVESGDPEIFAGIKKGETLEQVEKAIKMLQSSGIKVGGFFIVGLPGDSIQGTRKTLEFIRNSDLAWSHFNMLTPYPGTELWEWIEHNGTFLRSTKDGSHFLGSIDPAFETKAFTAKQMKKAYVTAYARPGFMDFLVPPGIGKWRRRFRIVSLLIRYDFRTLARKSSEFVALKLSRGRGSRPKEDSD